MTQDKAFISTYNEDNWHGIVIPIDWLPEYKELSEKAEMDAEYFSTERLLEMNGNRYASRYRHGSNGIEEYTVENRDMYEEDELKWFKEKIAKKNGDEEFYKEFPSLPKQHLFNMDDIRKACVDRRNLNESYMDGINYCKKKN